MWVLPNPYMREKERNVDRDPFNKWSNLSVYVPDFDATFAAVFNWNITTIHKQISHKGSIFHYQRVDAPFVQPNAILTVYLMGCTFSHKFVGTALQDLFVEAAKEKRCLADCLWWRIQDAGCSGTWGAITWVWYLHYLHLSIYQSIYLSI